MVAGGHLTSLNFSRWSKDLISGNPDRIKQHIALHLQTAGCHAGHQLQNTEAAPRRSLRGWTRSGRGCKYPQGEPTQEMGCLERLQCVGRTSAGAGERRKEWQTWSTMSWPQPHAPSPLHCLTAENGIFHNWDNKTRYKTTETQSNARVRTPEAVTYFHESLADIRNKNKCTFSSFFTPIYIERDRQRKFHKQMKAHTTTEVFTFSRCHQKTGGRYNVTMANK